MKINLCSVCVNKSISFWEDTLKRLFRIALGRVMLAIHELNFVEIKFLKNPPYISSWPWLRGSNFRPCIWPDVTERHALSDLFGAQHLLGSCEVEEPDIPSFFFHGIYLRKIPPSFLVHLSANLEKSGRFSTDPPCLGVIFWWGPKTNSRNRKKNPGIKDRFHACSNKKVFEMVGSWKNGFQRSVVFFETSWTVVVNEKNGKQSCQIKRP